MSAEILECDLLVIGAGMAGLSAAGWAAERGAKVVVVEKARDLGGSAVLSGGMLWTASSPERMALYGGGRRDLGRVVCDNYPVALDWLRRRGIEVSRTMQVLHGYGYQIDIIGHLRGCAQLVERNGGHVVFDTTTASLLRDASGRVTGGRTTCADGDVDVHARHTIIATGGYQGSPELRARYIHPNAGGMLLRSNPASTGDGLRLGQEAGAEVAGENRGFYGHLVSECEAWGSETRLYTMLSQYHSDHTLLLNEDGRRFCDESFGDHSNTYHTVLQKNGRALCFWDQRVQSEHATQPIVAIAAPMDRMAVALEYGGKGIASASLDEIAAFASGQGFDGAQVLRSIGEYNHQCRNGWETLSPPRAEHCLPLDAAPFYALVVHPAITFTFGGLTIDTHAQVLRPDGTPVEGLLAAGSDAGAAFGTGYAGGLALAMTFGLEAARTAGWN
jgi:succinate dehydrogenase/fumarate reductase flavoprotein subunit